MNINRHNCEEFFLLYIDNELSNEQRKQVEQFVQQNTDLEEELVMLQQSKLVPDESIVFNKKHSLMKEEESSFINMNNYEEWLMLYVDNELNQEQRTAVEKFAGAHPHVQQELALFGETKLQSEEIVFPNKEVLFRRERVMVITMQWWKIAVAAILIIGAGLTLYSILDNRNNNDGIKAGIAKKEIKKDQVTVPAGTDKSARPELKQAPAIEKENIAVTTRDDHKADKHEKVNQKNDNIQLAKNIPATIIKTESDEKDKRGVDNEINFARVEGSKIKDAVALGDKSHKEIINEPAVTKTPSETPEPIYAVNTDNSENKKLRGFFRKATRLIERTTNIKPADDDNKVLIGGMAINLK